MSSHRTRTTKAVAGQVTDLAFAVPQVVAHRLTRMALAGTRPSARDRKEFYLMGAEKWAAFSESWAAMAKQLTRENEKMALALVRSFWFPWAAARPSAKSTAEQMSTAAMGIVHKGVAPVHRRAVANAKRLGRR